MSQAREALNTEQVGQEGAAPQKPSSFLNPTGVKAKEAPPKAIGPMMELAVFFLFVLVRAAHPVVIAQSKTEDETGKSGFPYQSSSTVIVMTVSMCVGFLLQCYALGGKEQFATIWESRPFIIFSINGVVYAVGDYLEMAAIGGLPAAAYQILQQSRIILTALLMIPAKGLYQTRLQWTLLAILTFAMSTYMIIASGKKEEKSTATTDVAALVMGTIMAFAKVVISCVGAVISDKYMKEFKNDPTHVCIARTFVARAIAIVMLSFTQDIWTKGFFSGWNAMTIAVTASFIIKSVSTLYIVALLDSILKNIAEAFSVLVIYAWDVLAMGKEFQIATFLSVLVVVSACAAYVDSKTPIEKAKKWDKAQADKAGQNA
jgi:drug/metabolite transporter (DMT)-like permease